MSPGLISRRCFPFVIALALIFALALHSGISVDEIVASVRQLNALALIGILVSTGVFLALSTMKWRMVMGRLLPDDDHRRGWGYGFYYTALGAVLSLVVLPQAAMVIGRGYGDKFKLGKSPASTTAATLYEQLLDVVPILTFAATGLLAKILGWGASSWLAGSAAITVASGLLFLLVLRTPLWTLGRFVPSPIRERIGSRLEFFAGERAQALFEPRFVLQIYAISVLRYLVLMARSYLVFAPMHLSLGGYGFVEAYSIVSVSRLLFVTPGGLGIAEWSWTGILTWLGMPFQESVRFVLANRLFNSVSLLLIFALAYPVFAFGRTRDRGPGFAGR